MQEFWDQRYQKEAYIYGTKPNLFFAEGIRRLNISGHILLPAEGEGRNAVHAAKRGLKVTAFDISEEGRRKALALAERRDVTFIYHLGGLETVANHTELFDAIALIYAQFQKDIRRHYHRTFVQMLKPGGHLLLEGFCKDHQTYQKQNPAVGGPRSSDLLLDSEELREDFAPLTTLQMMNQEIALQEGTGHQGLGKVVRYIGRKP